MSSTSFFDRIGLQQKLLLLGALWLAAVALPTWLYWREAWADINFSQHEIEGLPHAQYILTILQRTQQHRGIAMRYLLADISLPPKDQRKKGEELELAIADYEAFLKKNHYNKELAELNDLSTTWHALHQQVFQRRLSANESFELHTELVSKELNMLHNVADDYQLSLDPEGESYFLISAGLFELPAVAESLAQIRGFGTGIVVQGSLGFADRVQLSSMMYISKYHLNQLEDDIQHSLMAGQRKRESIYDNYRATRDQYDRVIALAQNEVLDKAPFTVTADAFYSGFTLGINGFYSYASFSLDQMRTILSEQISRRQGHMYGLLFYVFAMTLLAGVVCFRFARGLRAQLGGEPQYAVEVVQAVTRGDLEFEVETAHPESLLANMRIMQQKLKENDRLKNEFISTVSHELRTPLTSIGGALMVATSGKMGVVPQAILEILDVAYKNTQRLTELVNDLLDVNKLAAGKLVMDLQVQPIMPIIDDACSSMHAYAHKYGVRLVMGLRYDTVVVNVDARRLRQALMNLLSNAAKFSKRGDEVVINTNVSHDRVRVEVVDRGQGIAPEFQSRIFQKFEQQDGSSKRNNGGTGLGLSIAKELVEAMGGIIGFTSTLGIGSVFFIEFPLEELNSD